MAWGRGGGGEMPVSPFLHQEAITHGRGETSPSAWTGTPALYLGRTTQAAW